MKFRNYHHDSRETPDGWRRELQQLLRFWEMGYRRGTPKKDTATDAQMWERLLPHARPIHPRTHLPGATENARLNGLDWESIARSGEVLIEGERVAIRWLRRDNDISLTLGGHGWQIAFEFDGLEADSSEYKFLERYFRTVIPFTGGCIASEEHLDRRSALVPLARFCFSQPTTAHLRRCWELARALRITHEFLALLDQEQRRELAGQFSDELCAKSEWLSHKYDARLALFADGADPEQARLELPLRLLPRSRLANLWETSRLLSHLHREIGDQYYEDLCFDVALMAGEYHLADLLEKLPVGLTALAGYDGMCQHRPRQIASLVWHPGTKVQGMFALSRLRNTVHFGNGEDLDLSEEWERAQHLGRKLFLMGEKCTGDEAVTLGLDDFSHHLQKSLWRRQQLDPSYWSRELWNEALAEGAFSKATTDSIVALLGGEDATGSDTALLFALHQLARLRELRRPEEQSALAEAVVAAYLRSVDVRLTSPGPNSPLAAFGNLLGELWTQLGSAQDRRQLLLCPFKVSELVELGTRPVDESDPRHYGFDVRHAFERHVNFLVALATGLDAPEEPLRAATDLYLATKAAPLRFAPFTWSSLGRERRDGAVPGVEPLFKRLAEQAMRAGLGDLVESILRTDPGLHILAAMRAGMNEESELRSEVEGALRSGLRKSLQEGGLALGQALDLAAFLNESGLGVEAQSCAEQAVEILQSHPGSAHGFLEEARIAMAVALANQQRWTELLTVELKGGGLGHQIVARNLRAAAHVELEQWAEAEEDFSWVLTHDPHNQTAIANLCASLSRQKRWSDLLGVVQRGLKDATGPARERLLVSEAAALEELGDSQMAALSLRAVGGAALEEGEASKLARRVLSGPALLQGLQIPVQRVLYCEGNNDSVDVRFYQYLLDESGVTVVAQGKHTDVRAAVRQSRSLKDVVNGPIVAGVVDRDHYPDEQLRDYDNDLVVLPFNEVECVLCHPEVVALLASRLDRAVPSESEVLRALKARATAVRSRVVVQRLNHRKGRTVTQQSQALEACQEEVEHAASGTADELLRLFPGKELLSVLEEFLGTSDASGLFDLLVECGEEGRRLHPLDSCRQPLLHALDLKAPLIGD